MSITAGLSILSIIEIFFHVVSNIRVTNNKVRSIQPAGQDQRETRQQQSILVRFLSSSSIHGLQYIQGQQTIKAKIFWAIQVVVSIALCSVLIRTIYKHTERSPVITSIDQQLMTLEDVRKTFLHSTSSSCERFWQIPFPSVVICPPSNLEQYSADLSCINSNNCTDLTREQV
jgi:Amiloride-sensitive sodium channel